MSKALGSIEDQRELAPLKIAGRSHRECMDLLGWNFGRVSEADRARRGVPSDSRDGRKLRGRFPEAKARMLAALRAEIEARREREAR